MSGSSLAIRLSQPQPCYAERRSRTRARPIRRATTALARGKSVPALNREALVRRGMKKLLGRYQPRREALGMVVAQEALQHLAVVRKLIDPEVIAHQLPHEP